MSTQSLVLNSSLEPLNIVSWERAVQLMYQGKVEVLEEFDREIRTISFAIKAPAVLRLIQYVPLLERRGAVRFSRENVFLRDGHKCQYCGKRGTRAKLTLDHVTPLSRGGLKSWENIVTACQKCNQKKGNRRPEELGFTLKKQPIQPLWLPERANRWRTVQTYKEWEAYLEHFLLKD